MDEKNLTSETKPETSTPHATRKARAASTGKRSARAMIASEVRKIRNSQTHPKRGNAPTNPVSRELEGLSVLF